MSDVVSRQQRRAIAKYVKERDAALRSLDPGRVARFVRANHPGMPDFVDPVVPEIMMHKCRLQLETFTEAEKAVSREWLLGNGYSLSLESLGSAKWTN